MFQALRVYHQEDICKKYRHYGILYIPMYMVYGESSKCGYTAITIKVSIGHVKVHIQTKYINIF
jgi:hypothetical protein